MNEQELRAAAIGYAQSEMRAAGRQSSAFTEEMAERFAQEIARDLEDDFIVRDLAYPELSNLSKGLRVRRDNFRASLTKGQKSALTRALGACQDYTARFIREANYHTDLINTSGIGHRSAAFLFLAFQPELVQLKLFTDLSPRGSMQQPRIETMFIYQGDDIDIVKEPERFEVIKKKLLLDLGFTTPENVDAEWLNWEIRFGQGKYENVPGSKLKNDQSYLLLPVVRF